MKHLAISVVVVSTMLGTSLAWADDPIIVDGCAVVEQVVKDSTVTVFCYGKKAEAPKVRSLSLGITIDPGGVTYNLCTMLSDGTCR
jgi:hypothetical protein